MLQAAPASSSSWERFSSSRRCGTATITQPRSYADLMQAELTAHTQYTFKMTAPASFSSAFIDIAS
jgi:hypothetical protein